MANPRNVDHPVRKTYITPTLSQTRTTVHVRVYAPRFALDKRGTGPTLSTAIKRALKGIPKAHPKHNPS